MRVLRWGSKVVWRKPRLQAADPTLKSAIRIPGFVKAFLMLGFTAFLENETGKKFHNGKTHFWGYSSVSKAGGSGVSGRTK